MPRSGELPRIGLRLLQSTPVIADTLGGGGRGGLVSVIARVRNNRVSQ